MTSNAGRSSFTASLPMRNSIFEGSDFNIDHAVEQALESIGEVDFVLLNALAGLQPIVAKRHYHETGALRWFDISVVPVAEIEQAAAEYAPRHGAIGSFFLAIPTQGESEEMAGEICRRVVQKSRSWDIVVGLSQHAWGIPTQARELLALERVRDETPELQGDRVARIEVQARIAVFQGQLESELAHAFNSASWYRRRRKVKTLLHAELNSLASDLADAKFHDAPRLNNELLGRVKPSSSAVAAQNALLRRMVLNEGEARLGIEGFPAEGGLFTSLLAATGLYRENGGRMGFCRPHAGCR